MEVEQKGIKWWKHCMCCEWTGKALKVDNDLKHCPNCGNPALNTDTDKRVFNGKRYDVDTQSPSDAARHDEVRQNEGRQPAPPDARDHSNRGFRYKVGGKPTWKIE